jgi:GNAT superfamily N-acetyltransferase
MQGDAQLTVIKPQQIFGNLLQCSQFVLVDIRTLVLAEAVKEEPAFRQFRRDEPWYLAVIGVDPQAAGKGFGGALLKPVLKAADAQGKPCYLETAEANNKPFYEKHGFVVVRHGLEPASSLVYWTFRREPR